MSESIRERYKVKQPDNGKRIKDIEPIELEGVIIKRKEDLRRVVEEPCLEACETLYDLNIETNMSSANRKDVGSYGYIYILF